MKSMFIAAFFITGATVACKKDSARGSDHLNIGTMSSPVAYAGKNRIRLTWRLSSGNLVKACGITWNEGKDSLFLQRNTGIDTAGVIVNHLEEGDYLFTITGLDDQRHATNTLTVPSHAYGSAYADSLRNRAIRDLHYDGNTGIIKITWGDAAAGAIGSAIDYTDSLGTRHQLFAPVYANATSLEGMGRDSNIAFRYRTAFLPETKAIDTFYTAFDTVKIKAPGGAADDADYTHAMLRANGPGDTYELIDAVLGGHAEETPDCAHSAFGRHIAEEYNDELKENVFAFYLHVTPDNDRCVNFDRQRCEIKTYGPSPDSLKAFNGDVMIFQWKFRLPDGFQPSSSFTHIHQIKAGDGPNDGSPIMTLTPRYGSPDKLQLIHTGDKSSSSQGAIKEVDLAPFKGAWIKATEEMTFGSQGKYALKLERISDGAVLLNYSNDDIDLWRTGSTFIRPKWGIYRSLNHPEQLRDEKVLFADFVIEKKK